MLLNGKLSSIFGQWQAKSVLKPCTHVCTCGLQRQIGKVCYDCKPHSIYLFYHYCFYGDHSELQTGGKDHSELQTGGKDNM